MSTPTVISCGEIDENRQIATGSSGLFGLYVLFTVHIFEVIRTSLSCTGEAALPGSRGLLSSVAECALCGLAGMTVRLSGASAAG